MATPLQAQGRSEPGSGLAAFRALAQRNIFDPTRTRRRSEEPSERRREPDRRPPVESVALTGTILYGGQAYAFFGGSAPDYRQVLSHAGQIAGFTVAEITTTQVVLQSETNQLVLPVGWQMRRVGDGAWELASESVGDGSPSGFAQEPTAAGDSSTNGAPAAPAGADDLLKLLMERRQKEMSQ